MVVNSVIVPNVGSVVNQNQGFVMNVTVTNNNAVNLCDAKVVVTALSNPLEMTVGVGLNVPISLPAVLAPGATATVPVVFETVDNITVGNHNITYEVNGYVGGPEYLQIAGAPSFLFDVSLHNVYPVDLAGGPQTETVEIHPE